MIQGTEVVDLLEGLYRAVDKVGAEAVLNKLNELNGGTFKEYEAEVTDYIIQRTCEVYSLKHTDLKKKNIRGDKVIARSMCFVQMKRHLNMSHEEIASYFGRDNHTVVSLALKQFERRDEKVKVDMDFIDKFNEIYDDVKEYKKQAYLKLKNKREETHD